MKPKSVTPLGSDGSGVAKPGAKDYEVWGAMIGELCRGGSELPFHTHWGSGIRPTTLTRPTHATLQRGHLIVNEIEAVCQRRNIDVTRNKAMAAPAAPCAPWLMQQLAAATERAGVPAFELPSGAGHDAMALAKFTDVAMLFSRCGNGGISHNPLETMTADDADVSARILLDFLRHFQAKN